MLNINIEMFISFNIEIGAIQTLLLIEHFRKLTSFVVWKGEKFSLTVEKPETDLTPEMIQRYIAHLGFKECN